MPLIRPVRGFTPQIDDSCWIADNATIVGEVTMGKDCSVWFSAVIRGDVNAIIMGDKVNIQDGAVIHGTYEKSATKLGNNVSVGHNALVHGCTIHDNVLIGMGAIVMDDVVVHSGSIIAAGAVVLAKTIVEPNSIYAGVPAKKVKDLTGSETASVIARTADNYVKYAGWFEEED